MGFGNTLAFSIGLLLILLVMTMVRVDDVFELPNLGFEMIESFLSLVEVGIWTQRLGSAKPRRKSNFLYPSSFRVALETDQDS